MSIEQQGVIVSGFAVLFFLFFGYLCLLNNEAKKNNLRRLE